MMKIIAFCRYTALLSVALLLAACATTPSGSAPSTDKGKWRMLGASAGGNIHYELDNTSIKREGSRVIFRDRKTVIDPQQQYYSNTPVYKVAISTTSMDCANKNFRVLDVALFNQSGELLREDHFTDTDLRPMGITNGSAAQKQYEAVCRVSHH